MVVPIPVTAAVVSVAFLVGMGTSGLYHAKNVKSHHCSWLGNCSCRR